MNYTNCNLCNSTDFEVVDTHFEDCYYNLLNKGEHPEIRTVICKKDGFVYANPQIERKDKERLYKEKYRPLPPKKYYGKNYMREEVLKWKIKYIAEFLGEAEKKNEKPFALDVGCGGGHLLYALKKRGWVTLGIEPTPNYADFAKKKFGLKVIEDFFENAKLKQNSFDLVILANVLEHLSNPNKVLQKINKILKEEGKLFVISPNVLKPVGNLSEYFRSEHLSYFSPKTITLLLEKCGFRALKMDANLYIRAVFCKSGRDINLSGCEDYKEIINGIERYRKYYKRREKYRDILSMLRGKFLIKLYRLVFPKK